MRHDDQRHQEDVRDRQEVGQRLVGQVGIQAGIDAERAARHDHQRVAVWRGHLAVLGGRDTAAASLVLDDDLLLPLLRQLLGHQAREDIGSLSGRERHDEAHGLVGPRGLRDGRCSKRCARRAGERHDMATRRIHFWNLPVRFE
jgi:hypothetical protein